jgi:hypothetical protein
LVLMSFFRPSSYKSAARRALKRAASLTALFGLLVFSSGCDVTLFPEVVREPTSNVCDTDLACGGGECDEGRCEISRSQIPALLLEVTPAAGVETSPGRPAIDGMSFTSVITDFDRGPSGYEINLEHVSVISGAVTAPLLSPANCLVATVSDGVVELPASEDGSVPAHLTLTPRQRLLGLSSPTFTAENGTLVSVGGGLDGYEIGLNVPPGRYDIYVEPAPSVGGCLRPPFLLIDQEIPPGNVDLNLTLPTPEIIRIAVRYPRASDDLKDWTLDIVQKDSGRLLSTRAFLTEPVERDGALEYEVELALSTDGTNVAATRELVRLMPPEARVAPTFYLERSLIDLFQEGVGLMDQVTELADAVNYRGRVALEELAGRAPAIVAWHAIALDSSKPGITAGFSRTVETDEDGRFETQLLPGTYRVLATPLDASYARKVVEVTVSDASTEQSGPTIEVSPRYTLTGELVSFNGNPVFGSAIEAQATPSDMRLGVLDRVQGAIASAPAAIGDLTGDDGSFALRTDAGRFNVSARPDPETGFAWAVRLGVDVSQNLSLPPLELPLPVVVRGRLISPTEGIVRGAFIRAFALLKEGVPTSTAEDADSVVAVGEARVNTEGSFELLLPSALK